MRITLLVTVDIEGASLGELGLEEGASAAAVGVAVAEELTSNLEYLGAQVRIDSVCAALQTAQGAGGTNA